MRGDTTAGPGSFTPFCLVRWPSRRTRPCDVRLPPQLKGEFHVEVKTQNEQAPKYRLTVLKSSAQGEEKVLEILRDDMDVPSIAKVALGYARKHKAK